jgi:NAD(P)-dependent dehydrogenase (short-subunit alcohol dehydrogenase family)
MQKQDPSLTVESGDARRAQRGRIVNIASTCGSTAIPNIMPYVVSKHAVVGITRAFAVDYGKVGIRINAVCPGLVETPIFVHQQALTAEAEKKHGALKTLSDPPLGRLALREEVADSCVFASSSMASYMHGAMLMADGGKTVEF